jgi:hypothetical protein
MQSLQSHPIPLFTSAPNFLAQMAPQISRDAIVVPQGAIDVNEEYHCRFGMSPYLLHLPP